MDKLTELADNLGQYFELAMVFIRKLLSLDLTVAQVKELIEVKEHPFWVAFGEATKILVAPPIVSDDTLKQIALWRKIYAEEGIGLPSDEELLKLIPMRQVGFNWLVIVPKGMTVNQAWAMAKKRFKCWKYTNSDLESVLSESERGETKAISITWFRDRVEADKEMKNLSANDLEGKSVKGITLLQRILLEVKYFTETGKHLDLEDWTLCSGSRFADGRVPGASWFDGEFCIFWTGLDDRLSDLRSRVVVG
ncbi:MAG TPA: hypothetical protein VMR73_00410 [Candidatus Paceibacterota bacterium]|nr:hypothetical protein [Candidatus Paceibacterota bacterium]